MGKVLAFINQKGGVGKTTSAENVGLSLAVSEIKTLIVDLDPQANATIGLSDLTDKSDKNIYDVLINNDDINSHLRFSFGWSTKIGDGLNAANIVLSTVEDII